MSTCPDCIVIKPQIEGNADFEIIDIGEHPLNLKAFLKLRDSNPAFDKVKQKGTIGIPCFVLENGDVTFNPARAGLQRPRPQEDSAPKATAPACGIDGTGC